MTHERAGTPAGPSLLRDRVVSHRGKRSPVWARVLAAIGLTVTALGPLSGCAVFRLRPTAEKPRAEQPPPASPVAEASAERDEEALTAIEEFLARTQQYGRDVAPASPNETLAYTGRDGSSASPALQRRDRPFVGDEVYANTQVTIGQRLGDEPKLAIPALQAVSIRWEDPEDSAASEPIERSTTNLPLGAHTNQSPVSLDQLVEHLRSKAEEHRDFDAEWRLKTAQLALDRDEEATAVSTALPDGTRRLLGALMKTALAIRNMMRNPMLSGEEALSRLDTLQQVVADRADPRISVVALCRKVVTFGAYDEMAEEDFVAGRSIQTIVYSEIRNLRALRSEDGLYETRLASRLEVLTAAGESVWQHTEPEIVDTCRRKRTDFFIAQRVTLPPTLPAGDYVLKVLVEDTTSGTADETSHSFSIRSPISVARGG